MKNIFIFLLVVGLGFLNIIVCANVSLSWGWLSYIAPSFITLLGIVSYILRDRHPYDKIWYYYRFFLITFAIYVGLTIGKDKVKKWWDE